MTRINGLGIDMTRKIQAVDQVHNQPVAVQVDDEWVTMIHWHDFDQGISSEVILLGKQSL